MNDSAERHVHPGFRLVVGEPDQWPRLAAFKAAHPDVLIGRGEFSTWQAVIPEPHGETYAACKAGDHDCAGRHETLAASYRALRDHYQQRERALAQAMADREEWDHATASARRLAIAADAELRRRHPWQRIEPLRSREPAPTGGAEHEQLDPARDGKRTETAAWFRDLAIQREAFRAEINERPGLIAPGQDPVRGDLGETLPTWRASGRDAILQPPKPEIIPSARILQLAEHAAEPDYEAAD